MRWLVVLLLGIGVLWWLWSARTLSPAAFAARYTEPLPPQPPAAVYHLGHSLVGRDMPAMLAQLLRHRYHSQLGWGASLNQHWQGAVPGLAEENRPRLSSRTRGAGLGRIRCRRADRDGRAARCHSVS
ncbi:hypothetical protein ACFSHQ_04690 [Gemmobacter lanyuensis]